MSTFFRRALRHLCEAALALLLLMALAAGKIAPNSPETQFREAPNSPPSGRFWLGTDDLGRDRFSRLLHGTRISLLLAPAASLLAIGCAVVVGGAAAASPRKLGGLLMGGTDLMLSLPWLFLLLTVRALLPLDVAPWISVGITFALLGLLGWAAPARVIRACAAEILASNYVLSARSRGVGRTRVMLRHVLPNLSPVVIAQFWSSMPVFILAEANLGLLGLGVTEPLASWGTMLRELETCVSGGQTLLAQYWLLAPVAVVLLSVLCLTAIFPSRLST